VATSSTTNTVDSGGIASDSSDGLLRQKAGVRVWILHPVSDGPVVVKVGELHGRSTTAENLQAGGEVITAGEVDGSSKGDDLMTIALVLPRVVEHPTVEGSMSPNTAKDFGDPLRRSDERRRRSGVLLVIAVAITVTIHKRISSDGLRIAAVPPVDWAACHAGGCATPAPQ